MPAVSTYVRRHREKVKMTSEARLLADRVVGEVSRVNVVTKAFIPIRLSSPSGRPGPRQPRRAPYRRSVVCDPSYRHVQ